LAHQQRSLGQRLGQRQHLATLVARRVFVGDSGLPAL
jgi:hypothetical protein